ncbi:hypothetical protein BHE90_017282 [Fusarium euwallaceae]|uniref:JmjC domain-containing protein n=1 Tax=Fusarium euwallaceae TaxID=1147111 RepID=A0A430KY17_9HYPO|nr:hypothetical protein BHE90_017282 [Fusarium euwallaceae]
MGERLVEALGRIKRDDSMHKISAPNLPIDLDLLKANFSAPNHDCQYAANTFVPGPKGKGYTNVHISERRSDFAWPDFSEEVAIPTKEEARKWLDDFCDNPPEKIVPYFSGHLHIPSHEHLLNPGPAILGNPKLADLHRPYWHIGGDRSANRFHIEDYNCSEDEWPCGLRSANLVLKGVKIWIGIKRHHTKEFEAFIARNWDCNGCNQRVGHQSLLIAPWRLEREGIDFVIEVQGPMELVDPGYGLYHGIVNMGSCIAMSMNYMLPGDCLKSTALRQCGDCGVPDDTVIHVPPHKQSTARKPLPSSPPHELSEPRMGLAARQATLPSAAPARRRPKKRGGGIWADAVPAEKKTKTGQGNDKETPRVTLESLQELGDKFKAMNLLYQVPTLQADQLPTERVFRLACAVSCRHAIQQFHSMVQSWNGRARLCEDVPLPGEDPISRIQYRVLLVDKYASMDTLYKYLLRQSQFGLVKEVEANRQGRMRADTSFVDKVLERTRWARQNYDYHYKRGKQWVAISDRIEGILPFLHYYPEPFNISPKQCPNLSEDELSSLASLLGNRPSKALLKAGVALQQAVEESQSVRFAWDRYEVDWNSLDENELISYLEVVDD